MCFAAADYFLAGGSPPQVSRPPSPGSPLYAHIVQRLWQSFDLPAGPLAYLSAMNPGTPLDTLWRQLVQREWPATRAQIDRGVPVTLNLVQVRSTNPGDLGQNHQVLVFGYEQRGSTVTLQIYDPNFGVASSHPNRDGRILAFDLVDASAGIRYEPARPGTPLFHAFVSPYRPVPPPAAGAERVDGWQGWTPRGALPDGRTAIDDPVLAANADGRAEAFVRTDRGEVFHCWQLAPNGGWSAWRTFDGTLLGTPRCREHRARTAHGRRTWDGRQRLAPGADGTVERLATAVEPGPTGFVQR
jgi:hypothetical protein